MEPVEAHAIAWSYAAIIHLGLDPKVVFHEGGYGVESEKLLFNFSLGVYIGVNGLQDAGLTAFGVKAIELGVPPYPHMLKWLRD
jgi:Na+/H+ antiporter NhaD/arsenite permease-like protein